MIEIRGLRDLLRLFFIFKREFLWAVAVTALVVVLGAFLLPNRFASDARLLVKPAENSSVQLPVQPGAETGFVQQSPQRDPLLDEEKLATSSVVMHRVAQAYIDLTSTPPSGGFALFKYKLGKGFGWVKECLRNVLVFIGLMDQAPEVDRLATRLAKSMGVSHDPGSNVMEMRVVWKDPGIAQQLSKVWVDAYFDERAKAAGGEALFNFYQTQSLELNTTIVRLKTELRQHLRNLDATSVEQRIDDVTDQLQQFYRHRREAVIERESLRGMLDSAKGRLPAVSGEVTTEREVSLNPEQQDMLLKLNGLKAQRLDLLRNFKTGAPPVVAIDESIRSLESQIAAIRSTVQRSRNLAPNGLGVKLRQDMQDAQIHIAQINANIAEIDAQISALQAEREEVMEAEPALSRLSLELSSAEKTLAQYSDYLLRARVIRDLNRNRLSNVTLMGQSSFVPARVFPKSMLMLALALPIGLGVGLVVIFLLYLMDQRIHDGGRIQQGFDVPVWASLPDVDADPRALMPELYRLYCRLPLDRLAGGGLRVGLVSSRQGEGVEFVARHLLQILLDRGHAARIGDGPAEVGEVVVVTAPPLSRDDALVSLRGCDLILLVVQARRTLVPAVDNAVTLLRSVLGHLDGIVLNRRVFEIPADVWRRVSRWLGAY
jgi:uncharacterized protein involved in exopolysaccharide biosynthesis